MRPPAAVIFDFDGVIIDSETAVFESHRLLYQRFDVELTLEEWCAHIGVWSEGQNEAWARRLSARCSSAPSEAAYVAEQHRILMQVLPREPMPGIRELLVRLREEGIPTAIASTSPADWVVPAIESFDLQNSFDTIVTGDQVARPKPEPDVYLEAAARLAVAASDSLAIEDSTPGLTAAKSAGMRVVAIPHHLTSRHDLSAADLVVSHASELTLEHLREVFERY